MATLNLHDLQFILTQIKLSEQHAAGTPLSALIENPLLPYGVRTVDGSYNNIVDGREFWGAADQPFARLLDMYYLNENDGDSIRLFFSPSAPPVVISNTDYGQAGDVVDADPRVISNLVADQSSSNLAAVLAAMINAGVADPFTMAGNVVKADALVKSTQAELKLATEREALEAAELEQTSPESDPEAYAAALAEYNLAKSALDMAVQQAGSAQQAFGALVTALAEKGLVYENGTWVVANVAPDEGLSAPYNSWFTLFGQFFDHGLDLLPKGGNGTVYIPLQPDDPLYVEGSPTNFMVVTRATPSPGPDGILGTADDGVPVNRTTPFVDQNQTYTSHASHQVFLREYVADANGRPVSTGALLNGVDGGLPTWADVKANALSLGLLLTDADVLNIPLIRTDPYGRFIPGANGFAQVMIDGAWVEGNAQGLDLTNAVRIGHAFLDDIAHTAAPIFKIVNGQIVLLKDDDAEAGNLSPRSGDARGYDDELLNLHFVTGDGRGNENIGLTAVHHIFHAEHNRQVEAIKATILASGDPALIAEWQLPDGTWNGERLFQAARFATEMQYQHLVFEEFARKIQPDIDLFVFNSSADINPTIVSEFADAVYRFGHSMLRETVDVLPTDGGPVEEIDLITAFLNPRLFSSLGTPEEAAAGIIGGMTRQVGNEIDEFVTEALRNNLLGLPLDLAAINIARARENGIPTLNMARAELFEMTGDTQLRPYTSWTDFALNLKNAASIVNFIAAYGTHASITSAATVNDKRAAAMKLVFGDDTAPADRLDFLNATGSWAGKETGLNAVDLWIGGLAEKKMPFGGMLGSTFSFVFEHTLENLQNGDRFYYLSRTQGLNFLNELEANSLAQIVMRNTALGDEGSRHLPGDIFSVPDHILEMEMSLQIGPDPVQDNPFLQAISPLVIRKDVNGDGKWDWLQYTGSAHVVLGGTERDDVLIAGGGDDTIWGDGGNDFIEAGYGVDRVHGGAGNDRIFNAGTDIGETDFLHGDDGDDVISGGSGLALIFGGRGSDFISTGKDGKEAFGGEGNDFILGGEGGDFLLGNEGDDWIEGGNGFDTIAGDNSELFFNSTIIGHDVMFAGQNEQDFDGESGDDIMVQGESVMRNEGMLGFDWAIYKGSTVAADADLTIRVFSTDQADVLRDRFDFVEAVSGWNLNDVIRGDNRTYTPPDSPAAGAEGTMFGHTLDSAGVARIAGLQAILGGETVFGSGNILLGGGGSDLLEGRGGDDILDGDAWLNVRISVVDAAGNEIRSANSLAELQNDLLAGSLQLSQLRIVREIVTPAPDAAIDTAVFSDVRANYVVAEIAENVFRVTHTGGTQADGSDVLRNMEMMKFSDGLVIINREATGSVTIDPQGLLVGRMLTARLQDIADRDGIPAGAITVKWQQVINGVLVDIPGATGASLTLTASMVGSQVRAVAFFTDARGSAEEIASQTSGIIYERLPAVSISGARMTEGQQLTAVVETGATLPAATAFQWQLRQGDTLVDIPNATGQTLQLSSAMIGSQIVLKVSFQTGPAFVEAGSSPATAIIGDLISGSAIGETLTGTIGDDEILGLGGNDTLFGLAGSDWIDGGAGSDQMVGGSGNDTYVVNALGDIVVELAGEGIDTVMSALASFTLGDNVENLTYTGTARFTGIGNALANTLTGGAAADSLTGGDGDDILNGLAGNDTLVGGAGNDTLNGGAGGDSMSGGAGDDIYHVDAGGDTVTEGGNAGIDTVRTTLASYTLGNNVENLVYAGNGSFSGTGNALANTLTGGAGSDTLNGQGGNDILNGGAGDDTLNGGAGNDVLAGGTGNDRLTGGTGADRFVFGAGTGDDRILGFEDQIDRIDISAFGITADNFGAKVSIADIGADTLVSFADDALSSIRLVGVGNAATITAADFILA